MRLGVLTDSLDPGQMAYTFVREANRALREGVLEDAAAFVVRGGLPCLTPSFAVMPAADAASFRGVLVATCQRTAALALACPAASRRIFYVWDLQWLREPASFRDLLRLYRETEVWARGPSHARALRDGWGVNAPVCPDWDFRYWTGKQVYHGT